MAIRQGGEPPGRLGCGLISPDPEACGGESAGGEEVSGEFVVSGCDTAEVLELVEEAFDEIALTIEPPIDRALYFAVPLGRDVSLTATTGDEFYQVSPVITAVGDDISKRQTIEQSRSRRFVGGMTGGEQQPDRQAAFVHHRVDLGAQSSTRTADGVIRAPFFPPAAC